MRLLHRPHDSDIELTSFNDDDPPPYAILSHTWCDDQEVTFNELIAGIGLEKTGFTKISFCIDRAAEDGIDYVWVDTCCIDKSTSDELSTAINSMFKWYQHAAKCYVYLSDVQVPNKVIDAQKNRTTWEEAFRRSRWFDRGWTLQELIAPPIVEFFSVEGKLLGSRTSLEQDIHEITKIPLQALRGQRLSEFDLEERMSWIAKRKTTRKEDKAYCLLGIFGVFLPTLYGEGEEHAMLRLREEITRRHGVGKATREVTLPRPCSTVPFRRDPDFVDRGDILARVDERCSKPAGRAALVGFGSFGKSQLAIEYAHRVRQRSPETWVFWVHASNARRFQEMYCDIAARAGLSESSNAAETLQLIRRWLVNTGRWLMIVDNADEEITVDVGKDGQCMSLASLLPQSDHGAVLITSRNADVVRTLVGREQDIISVDAMNEDQAEQLVINKLGGIAGDNTRQLVQSLECIPLALVHATSYINRLGPRTTISKYLEEISTSKAKILQIKISDIRRDEQASRSVFATWQASFDYIRKQRSSAADLLSFMSFFDRHSIPDFMVQYYTEGRSIDINGVDDEVIDFEEDVATLRAFSLIRVTKQENMFEMHRLVQQATRIWLNHDNAQEKWRNLFVRAMAKEFPWGDYTAQSKCRALLPHLTTLLGMKVVDVITILDWANVLYNAGWFSWQQGLYTQAEEMASKALEAQKEHLSSDGESTLESANLLGLALQKRGKYQEAEVIHRQGLVGWEKKFGPEHQLTLIGMNNLAEVLSRQGKDEEAEAMHRQILSAREKVLGPEHPHTLTSMENLVEVLSQRGRNEEAEAMNRQVLAAKEKVLGFESPYTLTSMHNLAQLLSRRGEIEEAEAMHRQTLVAREKVLGAEHPETLTSMNNLAEVLGRRGKCEIAEAMHRQALARREKVLGPEHPDTLGSTRCLAFLLAHQNQPDEATLLYERAVQGYSALFGDEHPTTQACRRHLSETRASQKQDQESYAMPAPAPLHVLDTAGMSDSAAYHGIA